MLGGILVGVLGAPIVLLAVSAYFGRPRDRGGRLGGWADRLRAARADSVATLGPFGGFVLFFGAGTFLTSAIGIALGSSLALLEGVVDRPVFRLVERIQVESWAHLMNVVGQMGNIPQSRGFGVVAAVALMFLAPSRRWVPPALIGTVIIVQKFAQAGVGKIVDRGHPPTTLGTFPSGGCSRAFAIFGVVLFLVLAYTNASRRLQGFGWGLIAMLAFVEGYTRTYLNKHWVTDVLGGWIFGIMLLAVAVFAGRALLPAPDPTRSDALEHADEVAA
jgi:membrane-associated phospholipid phosphatase